MAVSCHFFTIFFDFQPDELNMNKAFGFGSGGGL
jgi:hypothetical protein